MEEIPKPDSESPASLGQMNGFRMSSRFQAMAISDPMMMGSKGEADTFIVDLESFSNGGLDKDVIANSRINMQRSLLVSSSSSPSAGQAGCNSTPEKVAAAYSQPPVGATAPRSRWGRRYNSFKRSPPPYWLSDPKRVLLFFATLSSLGTLLLIYFTLCMSKSYKNDTDAEWQP